MTLHKLPDLNFVCYQIHKTSISTPHFNLYTSKTIRHQFQTLTKRLQLRTLTKLLHFQLHTCFVHYQNLRLQFSTLPNPYDVNIVNHLRQFPTIPTPPYNFNSIQQLHYNTTNY